MSLFIQSQEKLNASFSPARTMAPKAHPPGRSVGLDVVKRKRARKIRTPLGPFETAATTFEKGAHRIIEIVSISPRAIVLRARGLRGDWILPIGVAYTKAVGIGADVDTGPRVGAIRRG